MCQSYNLPSGRESTAGHKSDGSGYSLPQVGHFEGFMTPYSKRVSVVNRNECTNMRIGLGGQNELSCSVYRAQ